MNDADAVRAADKGLHDLFSNTVELDLLGTEAAAVVRIAGIFIATTVIDADLLAFLALDHRLKVNLEGRKNDGLALTPLAVIRVAKLTEDD